MRKSKKTEDITRIFNPLEIKHFLSFGAFFHIKCNNKTKTCVISLVGVHSMHNARYLQCM